ncbi:MAG: 50S ribosomal protein L28 [Candidatus Acidiferrum sp.]
MAMKCDLCGKGPHYGNVVSHANNTRRRRWNVNLKNVRALQPGGATKKVRACTSCIRAGRVKKAA